MNHGENAHYKIQLNYQDLSQLTQPYTWRKKRDPGILTNKLKEEGWV